MPCPNSRSTRSREGQLEPPSDGAEEAECDRRQAPVCVETARGWANARRRAVVCDHEPMADFAIRQARPDDARAMAQLMAAVAEERDGIATEPPVDLDQRAELFARTADATVVADAGGEIVGMIHVEVSRFGFGELGMLVDRSWRGRGVGSALVGAAVAWGQGQGLHKLCLDVFATNTAAIALYRKHGFVEEGRRAKHYRRASGELWDAIVMGRLL